MAPEARVLAACLRRLERMRSGGEPVQWLKLHGGPHQRAGEPDLLIVFRGLAVFAEIKRLGASATELQEHRLKQWRQAGATADVVRCADELEQLLWSAVGD